MIVNTNKGIAIVEHDAAFVSWKHELPFVVCILFECDRECHYLTKRFDNEQTAIDYIHKHYPNVVVVTHSYFEREERLRSLL